ncbi:hypothetical protein NC652_039588 [Populus alba x Populus x berolinensis]|nr:hypothetical protein NC652_039588 [Populus alba x Populus x berolinensis]
MTKIIVQLFSSNDDDLEFEELDNLCLMSNIDITKKDVCLMKNKNIYIDKVNYF